MSFRVADTKVALVPSLRVNLGSSPFRYPGDGGIYAWVIGKSGAVWAGPLWSQEF